MNKRNLILVFLAIVIVGVYMYTKKTNTPSTRVVVLQDGAVVKMGEDTYTPQNFQVKKGTKIIFENVSGSLRWPASDLHPSHLVYPEFDPKSPVEDKKSWEVTFDNPGEWGYHDHLAPYITGTVKVTD